MTSLDKWTYRSAPADQTAHHTSSTDVRTECSVRALTVSHTSLIIGLCIDSTMGKVLEVISDKEAAFIESQHVFFVATAPLNPRHHVSASPKAGKGSAVVLDSRTVAYADLTGSGAETAAHVRENGRMVLLFCNLERGAPKILRLHGTARIILAEDVPASLLAKFPASIAQNCGFRAVYQLDVTRISTSCGYSLPVFDFVKQRTTLDEYAAKEGPQGIFDYQTLKNSYSIDGLPSLALCRQKAPRDVVPVVEDGFVFGKVAATNGVTRRAGLVRMPRFMADASRRLQKWRRQPLRLSAWNLASVCLAFFALGLVLGSSTGVR
jgi:Pyridoxamine 5'-phosphate oxidase